MITSNEKVKYMKIVRFLEESSFLIKVTVKQLKMEENNKKVDFLACY